MPRSNTKGGAIAIYDVHVFNLGLAIGVDQLLVLGAAYSLYQRKAWVDLLVDLNLK
jgi:hypothetical protein